MLDLIAYLRARYAEEEALANAAWPSPWEALVSDGIMGPGTRVDVMVPFRADLKSKAQCGLVPSQLLQVVEGQTCLFLVQNQPARVLADIAARRAILDECMGASGARFPDYDGGYADGLDRAVWLLAQPYASRDDFDPSWRTA